MGLKPLVAVLLLVTLLLAGCSDKKGDDSDSTSAASSSGPAPANLPPTGTLNASLTNGSIPLAVNFTLTGSDLDGDPLNWTLAFGDGNSTNGTSLPATVPHNFTASGSFNVTYTLTDGFEQKAYNLTINATGGVATPPTQGPIQLTGTVTCALLIVASAHIDGGDNTFTVEPGQTRMTITLAYDDPTGEGVNDLDITITSPGGDSEVSEEVGPEPPLVFEGPEAGEWTSAVLGYSCAGQADYTLDIVFG